MKKYFLIMFPLYANAHVTNTTHSHMVEFLVNMIIFFAYVLLGLTCALIFKAIYRSFI